jgi:hypothetical protein
LAAEGEAAGSSIEAQAMAEPFVAARWLAEVKSWTGTFLRRHSSISLHDTDKMELKARLPTWSEALQLGKRPSLAVEIAGEFKLSGDPKTGRYSGTLKGTIRERRKEEDFEAQARFEFWRADSYGAMYHLSIEGGPGGPRDEPPDLNKSYEGKLRTGMVDWVFTLGTGQRPVLFPMVVSIPTAICRAVDLSALHRSYWDVPDPKAFGMGILHRHQQQWCLKPDGVVVIEPPAGRDGLYQATESFPPELAYSEQLPPPPPKPPSKPKGLAVKPKDKDSAAVARISAAGLLARAARPSGHLEEAKGDPEPDAAGEVSIEPIIPTAYHFIDGADVFHFVEECPAREAAIDLESIDNDAHHDLVDISCELGQRPCGTCMRMVGLGDVRLLASARSEGGRIGVFNTHIDLNEAPGWFSSPKQFNVRFREVEGIVREKSWRGNLRLRFTFVGKPEPGIFESPDDEALKVLENTLRDVGLEVEG